MDYIPNCFSEKLSKLPGKTDKDQNTWLPLWIHLMDTAGVMKRLAEYWVPDQEKRAICKSFSIEQFVPLCEFLALVHDMGKMTPLMTMKLLYGDSGEIRDRLFQSGLEIPERAAFGRDVNCSPHPLAGDIKLSTMIQSPLQSNAQKVRESRIFGHFCMNRRRNQLYHFWLIRQQMA